MVYLLTFSWFLWSMHVGEYTIHRSYMVYTYHYTHHCISQMNSLQDLEPSHQYRIQSLDFRNIHRGLVGDSPEIAMLVYQKVPKKSCKLLILCESSMSLEASFGNHWLDLPWNKDISMISKHASTAKRVCTFNKHTFLLQTCTWHWILPIMISHTA